MKIVALAFMLFIITIQKECSKEELETLKPFYLNRQKLFPLISPFSEIKQSDCDLSIIYTVNERRYYTLTLQENEGVQCQLRFILKKSPAYKNNRPVFFEFNMKFIRVYDKVFYGTEPEKNCISMFQNEAKDEFNQRLAWKFDKFCDSAKNDLITMLTQKGNLIMALYFVENKYLEEKGNKIRRTRVSVQMLMEALEAQAIHYFKPLYDKNKDILLDNFKNKQSKLETWLYGIILANQAFILKRINEQPDLLANLENQIYNLYAQSFLAGMANHLPSISQMYPDYYQNTTHAVTVLLENPIVVSVLFAAAAKITSKVVSFTFNKIYNILSVGFYMMENKVAYRFACNTNPELYNKVREYLKSDYQDYVEKAVNMECDYFNHHINGRPYRQVSVKMLYHDFDCHFILEVDRNEIVLPAIEFNTEISRKCQDAILSDFSEPFIYNFL